MNHSQCLLELARYLESQIPGALAPIVSPAAAPPGQLAAALFERQLALNPASAAFLERRGLRPATIRNLADIPAIPVAAFKELDLTTVPPAERIRSFYSSGTTGQKPSRHHHSAGTLAIYELAAESWFKRRMLGDFPWAWQRRHPTPSERLAMVSLTPAPEAAPHSSLVFMIGTILQRFGQAGSCFAGRTRKEGWHVDLEETLPRLEAADGPVMVFGTAFNFVHLTDELEHRNEFIALPPGSRVMETGGYKGRSREIPKEQLHERIATRLGINRTRIGCEYGMSELSSQAYDIDLSSASRDTSQRRLQFPPWCHATVVSAETGRDAAPGEPGLLRIIDLANAASVLGIQTEDLAVRHEDGIDLLGRARQAEPRGCSLMASDA